MATWHAYADRAALVSGTGVLVTGGHQTVRLQSGDKLSIETPDGNRLSAVIVDRTDGRLLLAVGDGPLIRLRASNEGDFFSGFKLSDGFSRESWMVQ